MYAVIRILRGVSGVTREDKIRNNYIRGSIEVTSIIKKIRENRLRWLGHILRRGEDKGYKIS